MDKPLNRQAAVGKLGLYVVDLVSRNNDYYQQWLTSAGAAAWSNTSGKESTSPQHPPRSTSKKTTVAH